MQRTPLLPLAIVAMAMTLGGCDMIGGIFKAGLWMGVIFVVVVVAILFWLYRAFAGRR
jgi:hypothetical protein